MSNSLAPSFLFRFAIPCRHHSGLKRDQLSKLGEEYDLPFPGEVDGRKPFATVRAAWHEMGFAVALSVRNKAQRPWCRETRAENSDGIQFWIDTRDTHNVHRAGRFCHRFMALPIGAGRHQDEPVVGMLAIPRARESAREIEERSLQIKANVVRNGYELQVFIPAEALTGYDPTDQAKLGFAYLVTDAELGHQIFPYGREFPIEEDPSLWGTLDLVK